MKKKIILLVSISLLLVGACLTSIFTDLLAKRVNVTQETLSTFALGIIITCTIFLLSYYLFNIRHHIYGILRKKRIK
jgi:hypothetical protein